MNKKELFINYIKEKIPDMSDAPQEAVDFWLDLTSGKPIGGMTETGGKIITYMQKNEAQTNNLFTSATIALGIDLTARSVSGSMRKLVTDGYVEKHTGNPTGYSLTSKGEDFTY